VKAVVEMDEVLKKNLKVLAHLQWTDSECRKIERRLGGVDERIESLGTQLAVVERQMEQERSQLEALIKQYRSDENEVKTIESGILKSNDKLQSVKNNKEYQSMLKEIEDLQERKGAIEDRMLGALDEMETSERRTAVVKADLAQMQRDVAEQQEKIRVTAEEQRGALAELKEEREQIWARLDPKLQKIYVRSTHLGAGVGVAAVVDAVCQECRMNIPPQAFIELQRLNELSMCPHCQRIIYPKAILEEDAG
jgi:uncharacterized protein